MMVCNHSNYGDGVLSLRNSNADSNSRRLHVFLYLLVGCKCSVQREQLGRGAGGACVLSSGRDELHY